MRLGEREEKTGIWWPIVIMVGGTEKLYSPLILEGKCVDNAWDVRDIVPVAVINFGGRKSDSRYRP